MTHPTFASAVAMFAAAGAALCVLNGATAQTPNLPIHASGSWLSDTTGSGHWRADFAILGNALSGVISVAGKPALSHARVRGSVAGTSIAMEVDAAGMQGATFSGTLSGTVLVGTYHTGAGDGGTWAGSWTADSPRIASQWPAGSITVQPKPSVDRRPQLSGLALSVPRASSLAQLDASSGSANTPTVSTNVLVNDPNDGGSAQNEPEVAIDPSNADHIAAGANDYSFTFRDSRPGFYASTDAGVTWPTRGEIPGLTAYGAGGDPVLDFDAGGPVYYAGIGFTRPVCPSSGSGGNSALFVARSLDGGRTYQNAVLVGTSSNSNTLFHDKPWIAADRANGNVYVAWSKFTNSCTKARIWEAASTSQGVTFDGGRAVSDDNSSTGASVAVGTDGAVNVVWLRSGNRLALDQCTNGGTTCGTDRVIANITPLPSSLPGTTFRVNSFPTLAVDTAPGGSGFFAVVWADYRSGNADIYFTLSNDNGVTWLTPKAIAAASTDEFFPTITIDDNHLQRVTYFRRTTQSTDTFDMFLITSGNGTGDFTAPTQLNDGGDISPTNSFDPQFIGDYIGVDASTLSQPIWMDSRRLLSTGNHQQDIYTATASGC